MIISTNISSPIKPEKNLGKCPQKNSEQQPPSLEDKVDNVATGSRSRANYSPAFDCRKTIQNQFNKICIYTNNISQSLKPHYGKIAAVAGVCLTLYLMSLSQQQNSSLPNGDNKTLDLKNITIQEIDIPNIQKACSNFTIPSSFAEFEKRAEEFKRDPSELTGPLDGNLPKDLYSRFEACLKACDKVSWDYVQCRNIQTNFTKFRKELQVPSMKIEALSNMNNLDHLIPKAVSFSNKLFWFGLQKLNV